MLHTYAVFKQFIPVTLAPSSKANPEGEYAAAFMHVGYVNAASGPDALDKAKAEFGLLTPVVEREQLH